MTEMSNDTIDLDALKVIAPNLKRRLSGVTSTIVRLVPLQSKLIEIASIGPELPITVPQISFRDLVTMRRVPRVWHARRNIEMLTGLVLKHVWRQPLKLLFTSASQREHSRYTQFLIRQMDKVVATSAKTAQYLENNATVIHHGIDLETFSPANNRSELRTEMGLPSDGLLIGCYGRIRAQKGTDIFVDAMIEVLRNHPTATGLVMGRATEKDIGYLDDLKDRVTNAGLIERILFLPEVPVWQMASWYQVLDLYVAPQRWEGFGLTPMEALACGAPVVATDVGAFDEIVDQGSTGTIVPPDDLSAMINAIEDMISSTDGLFGMRKAARDTAIERFDIVTEAEKLVGIYRDLLSNTAN